MNISIGKRNFTSQDQNEVISLFSYLVNVSVFYIEFLSLLFKVHLFCPFEINLKILKFDDTKSSVRVKFTNNIISSL